MSMFYNLYFDDNQQRFAILADEQLHLHFVYWHALKKCGIRTLIPDAYLGGNLSYESGEMDSRKVQFEHLELITHDKTHLINSHTIQNKDFNKSQFLDAIADHYYVFVDCRFTELELENVKFTDNLVFINCTFTENFRLLNCHFEKDLWLPNCTFKHHFSLKQSRVVGNVHLEGSDFSGAGGASFRRLRAANLFLDLGITGCDDLFWLNEMNISGLVAIGGKFSNEIQLLACQDIDEDDGIEAHIGSLTIGKELYQFENTNKTHIDATFQIKDYRVSQHISINNASFQELVLSGAHATLCRLKNVNISADLTIRDSKFTDPKQSGVYIVGSSIGRHLKIENNSLGINLCLTGSSVSEITYIENNKHSTQANLDMRKFTSSRVIIYPDKYLLHNASFGVFSPRQFDLLIHSNKDELGDQYCSLKNWLADSGKLALEDTAYYHMRQCYQRNVLTRVLFGGVFGWGVRLSNIALSSLIVIGIFALVFKLHATNLSIAKALSLSIQSFISSFFGKWDDFPPDGLLSSIVTLESVIGVIFITVFVGAYLRKLLR